MRYFPDGTRTAQYVKVDERNLCLDLPEFDEPVCAIPLACTSDEADYVMLTDAGDPIARITVQNDETDSEIVLEEGHDWVKFAGGTFSLTIDESDPLSSHASPSINSLDICSIGAGVPEIDNAYAYRWTNSSCKSLKANGFGTVVYLDKYGEFGQTDFGHGRGLIMKNGKIYWDFPEKPIVVSLQCLSGKDEIPTTASEVKSMVFDVDVPRGVSTGEPLIYNRIVKDILPYGKRICGVSPRATPIKILLNTKHNIYSDPITLMVIDGTTIISYAAKTNNLIKREKITDEIVAVSLGRLFGEFLKTEIDRNFRDSLREMLIRDIQIDNLADVQQEFPIKTLVALVDGLQINMPWSDPVFENGKFQVTWKSRASDPFESFFIDSKRSGSGWQKIRTLLPSRSERIELIITCLISPRDATRFPEENLVEVRGTLVSYANQKLVLNCSSP